RLHGAPRGPRRRAARVWVRGGGAGRRVLRDGPDRLVRGERGRGLCPPAGRGGRRRGRSGPGRLSRPPPGPRTDSVQLPEEDRDDRARDRRAAWLEAAGFLTGWVPFAPGRA